MSPLMLQSQVLVQRPSLFVPVGPLTPFMLTAPASTPRDLSLVTSSAGTEQRSFSRMLRDDLSWESSPLGGCSLYSLWWPFANLRVH